MHGTIKIFVLGFFGATVMLAAQDGVGSSSAPTAVVAPQPFIKDYGLFDYVRISKTLPHREPKTWTLVCTMPHNAHFQPWIELEAPAGREIFFNSTNPLVLYLTPTEKATTVAGQAIYEAENWISGEGAIYTIPADVTVKSVKYRETGYDTTFAGSFECNDEDFNILWKRAVRTAYICMREHFYDCPDRERVGFWGDGTPELNQCFYAFDEKSHRLCRELVLRPLEPKFYPGQHLEFLGEYGLWFYYMHTGDEEAIKSVYDATKTFLFETYRFGNPKTWFDWGVDEKDTSVLETCFMYIDLGTLRKMAVIAGKDADLPAIDARREAIKSTFDEKYWKGSFYRSADVKSPDDRANAMAINAGLADRSKWDAIFDNVLSKKTNSSCFFDRWVSEALFLMGREEFALTRMAKRYRTMIDSKFSTLWEHYDRWWASRINAFDEGSSLNHGWNPPALLLSKDIAGVRPIEPGFKKFEVMPKEAFLTSIKVVVPSIKGPIAVHLRKSATDYEIDLSAPEGTIAHVGIPRAPFTELETIHVNGELHYEGFVNDMQYGLNVNGVTMILDREEYVVFSVGPGNWRFRAHGTLRAISPKAPRPERRREKILDSRGWIAKASVPDGSFPFSGAKIPIDVAAANAIDGDFWTGWRDMSRLQCPGQWFQVDMLEPREFDMIELDNTWALWDSPTEYSVSISADGQEWSAPIAAGRGTLGITRIPVPLQKTRFLRVTQTASNSVDHWSIYEITLSRSIE